MKAAGTDNTFKGLLIGVSILLLFACLALLLALTVGPLAANSAVFSLPGDSSTYLLAKYQMAQERLFVVCTVGLSTSVVASMLGTLVVFGQWKEQRKGESRDHLEGIVFTAGTTTFQFVWTGLGTLGGLVGFGQQLAVMIQLEEINCRSIVAGSAAGLSLLLYAWAILMHSCLQQNELKKDEFDEARHRKLQQTKEAVISPVKTKEAEVNSTNIPPNHLPELKIDEVDDNQHRRARQSSLKNRLQDYNTKQPLLFEKGQVANRIQKCIFQSGRSEVSDSENSEVPDFPCVVENVSVINSKSFRDKVPRLKMELIRPQLKAINTAPLLHDLDLSAIAPIQPTKTAKQGSLLPYSTNQTLSQAGELKILAEAVARHIRPNLSEYRCDLPPLKSTRQLEQDASPAPAWIQPSCNFQQ